MVAYSLEDSDIVEVDDSGTLIKRKSNKVAIPATPLKSKRGNDEASVHVANLSSQVKKYIMSVYLLLLLIYKYNINIYMYKYLGK